ncbi:hexose transporter [Fusarium mexicanum]|uniref:Hexose transporter n=1 Tax=Fusarium mexicanum TaxID=751941 RepID=A0A8H5JK89_9HYPO|nr:hexose transporter [Fusarium mexicanum]
MMQWRVCHVKPSVSIHGHSISPGNPELLVPLGVSSGTGTFLIFNQYANPIGVTNSGWKYYITYDIWLAVEAIVVYFLFVETRGLSLEETALVLDGPEMGDKLVGEVLKNTEKTVQVIETEKRGSI